MERIKSILIRGRILTTTTHAPGTVNPPYQNLTLDSSTSTHQYCPTFVPPSPLFTSHYFPLACLSRDPSALTPSSGQPIVPVPTVPYREDVPVTNGVKETSMDGIRTNQARVISIGAQ